jgi:hypothetical protein
MFPQGLRHALIAVLTLSQSVFVYAYRSLHDYQCNLANARLSGADATCSLPHGLAPSLRYHPWTHQPQCIQAGDEEYCLFTNALFRARRGISIITTREIANKLAATVGVDFYDIGRQDITRLNRHAPIYMQDQPGRGFGLFAMHNLKPGQNIMMDYPALVVKRDALGALSPAERQDLQWRAILQLPETTQKKVRSLARSNGGDEIDDIFRTNSIGLRLVNDTKHLAVIPEVAVSVDS